jgi:tetratricopeptide (TPR) repeat protein
MQWRRFLCVAAVSAAGLATAGLAQERPDLAPERFDYAVRDDMFRAFGGNEAAYKSAMLTIDQKLAENPDHAVALVWRGVGRYLKAGQILNAGDTAGARTLADAAMSDMDRAFALEPRNIGVLIPRSSVLLVVARNQCDPEQSRDVAARAAAGFESAFALRRAVFATLGLHNRGEYLSGLAESWVLAGDRDKASGYLQRILSELPNSPYAQRATAKLANWDDRRPLNCQSCH